ncbi:MAG: ATP-binding protein [Mycobacteriales bacterium]
MTATEVTYPRRALSLVEEALEDTRVVVINGLRQSGKSTLAQTVLTGRQDGITRYLDDDATRLAAAADPVGFVRHDGLMIIDEVQRVTDLILAIKHRVDVDPRPGQYLLTGSAQLLAMRDVPDSLLGRSETVELWPLSQGEIDGQPDGFIDAIFHHGSSLRLPPSADTRRSYVERAIRGGFPEVVRRDDPRRRHRFFESYMSDLVSRDIRQLSAIERPADLRRLLNVLAATMAGLLVAHRIGNDVRLPGSTIKRYLDLLELVYLIHRIPAWACNLTTRAVSTPKLLFTDSGVAGHLAGWTLSRASNPVAPVGPFIENFVLTELARQLTWATEPVRLYHFRTKDGIEVDGVLERASGEIVSIEVKAAETVRSDDFRGLRYLSERAGDRFEVGCMLYCGSTSLSFGNNMIALPISAIWQTEPPTM